MKDMSDYFKYVENKDILKLKKCLNDTKRPRGLLKLFQIALVVFEIWGQFLGDVDKQEIFIFG